MKGRGLAITGIVLGYVGVVFIVAFFALGIYGIRKAARGINDRKTSAAVSVGGSESSVVSSIRSLNMAEIAYGQAHRSAGFTCSLPELSGAWGISGDLASGRKHGYIFELKNCSAIKPGGPIARYELLAYSADPGSAGAPTYCSDESDVIRVVRNGSPQDCLRTGTELSVKEIN